MRYGIAAALLAVIALALPSLASADLLGSTTLYKSGLRESPEIKSMTPGPDGNVWFVDDNLFEEYPAIGRITPAGTITEYEAGEEEPTLTGLNEESNPTAIVAGPGGSKYLWFTDRGETPAIGVIDSTSPGTAKEFSIQAKGGNEGSVPQGIVVGPEGNLWFADTSETKPAIGKIELSGPNEISKITECSTGLNPESQPRGIIVGSDGNLWFTDDGSTRAIGKVNPSTFSPSSCEIAEFATGENSQPGGTPNNFGTWGIAAGPDGNVWFTESAANGKGVCRMLTSGEIGKFKCFNAGLVATSNPFGLTAAPDGKLWFTDNSGIKEQQQVNFAGMANGDSFKLCNEAKTKCSEKTYSTTTSATKTNVSNAMVAIYGAGVVNPSCSPTPSNPTSCTLTFQGGELVNTNVGQTSCEKVSGTGSCSTGTNIEGIPGAVDSISTSGAITRYPINGLATVAPITAGPDGNVWFGAGFSFLTKLGKFGIEGSQLTVNETGLGTGTVTSSPAGISCGSECSADFATGTEVTLTAAAGEYSEFTGWSGCTSEEAGKCKVSIGTFSDVEVSANFKALPHSNRRTLTLTKSAGGTGGIGTVSSKPKGIKCGGACNKAVASLYKNSSVELSAKPSTGSTFTGWEVAGEPGACPGTGTCTVTMSEAKEVTALFGGTSKAILSPTALTVSKGESTGHGYVKASGLACEGDCTETRVLYQGPITEPKPKPAKTVELSQTPSFGSEFKGWLGCDTVTEGKCIVTMSSAKSVTATYAAKPNVALTIAKNTAEGNYTEGTGTVTSKPKGLKCATTCTKQTMAVPKGEAVILKEKPATGMTFVKWEGGGCSGNAETCTVSPTAATTVKAVFSGTPKAIANEQKLTLNKAGSGFGTVKGTGIACEALCTSATSLYAGPITEPKPKPAATVTLEGLPAPGSGAVEWFGCDTETEGKCVVTMSAAKEVIATFKELK
jgi:streptogramin lyase